MGNTLTPLRAPTRVDNTPKPPASSSPLKITPASIFSAGQSIVKDSSTSNILVQVGGIFAPGPKSVLGTIIPAITKTIVGTINYLSPATPTFQNPSSVYNPSGPNFQSNSLLTSGIGSNQTGNFVTSGNPFAPIGRPR